MFEPQSTNLITQSNDLSQWIIQQNATVSSPTFVSPSGENNANLIDLSADTDARVVLNFGSASTEYTFSIYLKKHESDIDGTFPLGYYNGSNYIKTYVNLTDKWQRFSLTFTNPSGSTFGYGLSRRGTTSDETLTRCYAWGGQQEALPYATSYIPTNGEANGVTRNQDVCANGGSLATINSTEGVLYAQISAISDDIGDSAISINNGDFTDRIWLGYSTAASRIYALGYSNNILQFVLSKTLTTDTEMIKVAVKYKENDFALWVDGTEVATDNSGLTPIGLNSVDFTINSNGASPFFGKTKALAVWKEALSDEELAELTYPTPTDPTFSLDFDTIAEQFTFARGSEATYVDAQGLIQSTNELGEELITNGDFSNGLTDWSVVGGSYASVNNGILNSNNTLNGSWFGQYIAQDVSFVNGKKYKLTFKAKNISGNTNLRLTQGANVIFSSNITSSFVDYEVFYTANADNNSLRLFCNDAIGEFAIDNVSVKEYITATNTPRLDYSTGAEAFLLEPQSTNLLPYSEDFSQWYKVNYTVQTNVAVSPSGNFDASFVTNPSGGGGLVRQAINVTPSTAYTFSFYAKRGTASDAKYSVYDNTNGGDIISTTSYYSQINSDTFTRITVSFIAPAGCTSLAVYVIRDSSAVGNTIVWGAQLEALPYATSYIPSNGSQTTRNQETCINATPEINSEEGVLYAEISALANDGTNRYIFISDGTNDNGVRLYYTTVNNRITARYYVNGTATSVLNFTLPNGLDFNKIAFRYRENDFSLWANGFKVANDTLGATNLPNTLTNLSFATGTGGSPFFGNTKDLKYYPKALSDAELIKLTT